MNSTSPIDPKSTLTLLFFLSGIANVQVPVLTKLFFKRVSPLNVSLFTNHKSEFKGLFKTFEELPSSIKLSFIKTFTG